MNIPLSPNQMTTLDEPVSETIYRDLKQIGSKLKIVLLPHSEQDGVIQKLRDWDLWGPLVVCLALSIILSISAPSDQKALVFAAVFVIVWCGSAIVTLNAQLLGGTISFFQSICILGYSVFPLAITASICLFLDLLIQGSWIVMIIKVGLVAIGFVWSTRASVVFIEQIISPQRKLLAVYPVFFFYTFISWMILLQ